MRSGTKRRLRAAGPADLSCDGPRLLRPAAGGRPPALPAAAAQPVRRRGARLRARSPFVGVSNDALVLHPPSRRQAAALYRYRAVAAGGSVRHGQRLVRAFKQRYERLVAASARLPLERLCEEIVSAHDYDLAVLAQWDGKRRYANLRKLMRLARSYEELRGPDIEGFVKFIRDQEAVGASQLEAVSEEEGADAVRLLTIHAAKGLEFKVVIVADAGRDTTGAPSSDEILVRHRRAVWLPGDRPEVGQEEGVSATRRSVGPRSAEDRAERLRLYYVAMTRAVDRLIVSGAIDPERSQDRETPIGWVLGRLGARATSGASRATLRARARGSALPARGRSLGAAPSSARAGARSSPKQGSSSCSPSCRRSRRRAATACLSSSRCPRRSHRVAALVLGARALRALLVPLLRGASCRLARSAAPCRAHGPEGDRDRRRRAPPARNGRSRRAGAARRRVVRRWYPAVSEEEVERIARSSMRIAARSSRPGSRRSRGCSRSGRSRSSTTGCCCAAGSTCCGERVRARSSSTTRRTRSRKGRPEEIVEADYRLQRLVYALACFRAGADRSRSSTTSSSDPTPSSRPRSSARAAAPRE